jgi:transcriptional regulator with XRE-family HTH domain
VLAERLSQSRAQSSCASAQKFAERLGVALNTVYRIERGDVSPTVETLRKWAEVCGVSADELLGMESTSASASVDVNGGGAS